MTWTISGRTVLITGGNSGIGLAAATALARDGARVAITTRDPAKGEAAAAVVMDETGISIEVGILDLADLESVRGFGEGFLASHDELAVLINNAGAVIGSRQTTKDGFELTFGANHLGPFLLTNLLTDLLIASAPARIINVGSSGHGYATEGIVFDDLMWDDHRYKQREVYGHSKLANILHAREANRRLSGSGVTAYSIHPGLVRTSFGTGGDSFMIGLGIRVVGRWLRSPEEGADSVVWAATDPDISKEAGSYFTDREVARSTRHARDDGQAKRLWEVSEQILTEAEGGIPS
jgi:NAD(P)-dependent dehydrogenase (short-subunit alcohol dehydrogenase family)